MQTGGRSWVVLFAVCSGCVPSAATDAGAGGTGGGGGSAVTGGGGGGTTVTGGGGGSSSTGGGGGGGGGGGDGGMAGQYAVDAKSLQDICFGAPPFALQVPRSPSVSVTVACSQTADETPNDAGEDAIGLILGRWERCAPVVPLPPVNFEGLEFQNNGLFSTLVRDADGGHHLTPDAGRGSFDSFAPTQVGITWEGLGTVYYLARYSTNRDTVEGVYQPGSPNLKMARLPPDPTSTAALPPEKLVEGRCPFFGVWDTIATTDNTRSTILFGNDGRFVGSPVTGDACHAPTMWGIFWIQTDKLTLAKGEGFSPCQSSFETVWSLQFSADCQELTTSAVSDNCTGGRPYLTNTMTLRRR